MARIGRTPEVTLTLTLLSAACLAPGAVAAGPPSFPAEAVEFFEKSVRPVLAERCLGCHGASKQKAGLRLDSRESVLRGGETGPAVIPGKPAESLLVEAVNYGDTVQMPPKSRLPAGEVKALTRWVEMGLPWPAEAAADAAKSAQGPRKMPFDLKARRDTHWAWAPVRPRTPPDVKDTAWPRGRVDRFILAGLESHGLAPAPDADRRALIRRLSFDLTGLPPTPDEVRAFEIDRAPDAIERLVDRLLASPRFGERWARHWLDLVRYAETRGHEYDPDIPNPWHYRDYLVRAFNADVPYDRFLAEHLAGDLMERPRVDPVTGANESILGTGFWFLGEEVHSPVDIRQDETDRMDNRLDVMSKTFLGLTVACARCHDHKFDAITQRDYYALGGFLISSTYRQVRFATIERERQAAEASQAIRDQSRARLPALAARAALPGLRRLADDLLATRTLLSGDPSPLTELGSRAPVYSDDLDAARDDVSHPLHAFAARDDAPGWSSPSARPSRLVVDFGAMTNLAVWQNGFAFGLRPVRPGDVVLDGDGTGAVGAIGLASVASARRDRIFANLPLAPGTQRDHGRLGSWDRAGQTLRTPEFILKSGRLLYLARGAGRAYASVNSHLIVNGPLHNAVFTEWRDGKAGWRWVRHNLSDYAGHRVHVEFSPSGPGGLEIARVIETDDGQEPSPPARPNGLALAPEAVGARSPEAAAQAIQSVFLDAARRMATGAREPDDPDEAEDLAAIGDWIVRRVEALARPGDKDLQAFREEAARLTDAEGSLARQVAVPSPTALAMFDGNGVDEYLLIRGSSRTPAQPVPRRFLEAVGGDAPLGSEASTSGRLALVSRMLDPSDPFVSRVIVNRVWHHMFGRGIVPTTDNFGVLGEPPSDPALLDDLADRFVRDGWSVKRLVRELALSRTYAMSSRPEPKADEADPDNRLWHRMPIRRLEAEPLRDAILSVSGRLDGRMYGPSIPVHLTPFMEGRGRPGQSGPLDGDGRRSLYLAIRRNFLAPMMLAFDAPIPFNAVGRRNVSNVPAQALILMNDPFVVEQAGRWADRVMGASGEAEDRVALLYRLAFARDPRPDEVREALGFLESQARARGVECEGCVEDRAAWADLAHVLINAKEFIFID